MGEMIAATKSQKGAATRDQILDAAARLIYLQGYHCTSLDDVLRASGVGKGNFYYYFKSKEELGYAIIDRMMLGFIERTLEPVLADPSGDPIAQIHSFISGSATASAAVRSGIWPPSCPTCMRGSGAGWPGSSPSGA
jgi:AcrR family transcriptional regulator